MTTPFVAVTDSPAGDDLSIERVVLAGMQVERVEWHDQPSLTAAISDADAVLCMHARLDASVIRALRRCKVIARFGTGLDNIDREAAQAASIPVVGVHDYCTQEVADHTFALLLAWNRRILEYHQFVLEKRWNERPQTTGNWGCGPLGRLAGQTLGVMGFGHIGRAVARRARAFGMRVLAHSRNPDRVAAEALGVTVVTRDELFQHADYLSLHLPLTDETRHLINEATIRRMKPGAVLINTSRGGLVDEPAIVDALRAGRLGGTLLDVYERAPLPVDHPFRTLSNVILSPHVAFYSEESMEDLRRLTAEAVRQRLVSVGYRSPSD